jgi:polysaccharide pyruvyl transferase WcaK-like protein
MKAVRILLGGVPFGRNNVGDEAILQCIVTMIRELCPSAGITVSTDDQDETARRLGVETVPLFGFEPPYAEVYMRECIASADVFVWAGATGLSDYPEIPLSMLGIAHECGTKTVVWGVGMNDEFNPYIYKMLPGKRRSLLKLLGVLTGNRVDYIKRMEREAEVRVRATIARELNRADLVMLRDPETLTAVQSCGPILNAIVGADPAELLLPDYWDEIHLTREARSILESDARIIGLCISAQREVVHQKELVEFLDRLVETDHKIVFLPMNHVTDAPLMEKLREQMTHPDQSVVIGGKRTPGEILGIAGALDLVISSRLHLLILASLVQVPIIGIRRGSKVDNYLSPFGHIPAGSVDACDFDHMQQELDRLIDSSDEFAVVSESVHEMLLLRLDIAKKELKKLLEECGGST